MRSFYLLLLVCLLSSVYASSSSSNVCVPFYSTHPHLQSSSVQICPDVQRTHAYSKLNYTICHSIQHQLSHVDMLTLSYTNPSTVTYDIPICHHRARKGKGKPKHACQHQLSHSKCIHDLVLNIPIAFDTLITSYTKSIQVKSHNGTRVLYTFQS